MTLEKEDTLKKDTRHGSTNEGRYMFRLIFVNFAIFFSLGGIMIHDYLHILQTIDDVLLDEYVILFRDVLITCHID